MKKEKVIPTIEDIINFKKEFIKNIKEYKDLEIIYHIEKEVEKKPFRIKS